MVEYQLGAGVPQPTTAGSLWEAMSGRPLSADLLDWPPDLFAFDLVGASAVGGLSFCTVAAVWASVAAGITKRVVDHGRGRWPCVEWRRRCPRGAGSAVACQRPFYSQPSVRRALGCKGLWRRHHSARVRIEIAGLIATTREGSDRSPLAARPCHYAAP